MEINDVLKAAEWLNKTSDINKLNYLKNLSDNQVFYVTVWGHYSAGKSKLINSIFDRDILPVQSRETTAVLTYIRYGIHEGCTIIYEDGSAKSYDLSVLKDIFQNTGSFEEISSIDHIEVNINNELLRTGLVLVDTPGVNTVIQKHQDLAVDAIEQSGRIIYVLGNPPSNVDRQFIKQISDCGIKISFVRTKCDRFNEKEENPEESLKKEAEEIEDFINAKSEFIPVSNEKNSKWHDNIDKVRNLIRNMSQSISSEMEQACENRIAVFAKEYAEELSDEQENLKDIIKGDTTKIDAEIKECENSIRRLELIVSDISKKIDEKVKSAQKNSKYDIDRLISDRIDDFESALADIKPGYDAPEQVKSIYAYHFNLTVQKLQGLLNTYFEDIIQEETDEISNCVSDGSFNIAVPDYAEVQQENSRILEMLNSTLANTREVIQQLEVMRDENISNMNKAESEFSDTDYDNAISLLHEKLNDIPGGMALRLSENQKIQPSTVMKYVGNAADMAMLLIPGDAIVSGIKWLANTTKIAQGLNKMGKVGKVILSAGTLVAKNANTIDKVRDTVYTVNEVLNRRNYSTKHDKENAAKMVDTVATMGGQAFEDFKNQKRSGNVLDALSIAYWTEKFGRNFDSEPIMEIDREEEERRNQYRKQITEEYQKLTDERIKKKKNLGLMRDKNAELQIRAQEEEHKQQRIEESIKDSTRKIKQEAEKKAIDKYCKDYKAYYSDHIINLSEDMSKKYFSVASQNIAIYIKLETNEVMNNIEIKKSQLNELLGLRDKKKEDAELRMKQCNEIKSKLELVGE